MLVERGIWRAPLVDASGQNGHRTSTELRVSDSLGLKRRAPFNKPLWKSGVTVGEVVELRAADAFLCVRFHSYAAVADCVKILSKTKERCEKVHYCQTSQFSLSSFMFVSRNSLRSSC